MKEAGNKKKIAALAVALVLLIGGTYAWLTLSLQGEKTARIEAGNLELELYEGTAITIPDAFPKSDTDGKAQTDKYTFTLNNTGNIESKYTVYLDSDSISADAIAMPQHRVKYALTKKVMKINGVRDSLNQAEDPEDTVVEAETVVVNSYNTEGAEALSSKSLDDGTLAAGNYIMYELRLWIDENTSSSEMQDSDGKVAEFSGKLRIEASQTGIEDDAAYPAAP